ncbi:MAG TPA: LamG domain-containing protein [Polyangia bacterium]|nr:LamG domain-containing protein [Polyangia bacterium]
MFFLSSVLACGSVGALRHDSAGDSDTVVDAARDAGDDVVDAGRAGSCLPIREGMVAWWPGDGNGADLLGGTPGTLQGNTRFVAGEVGQAFSLDGVNDWIDLGNAPKLRISSTDFSVEAWVLFNSHQGDMSVVDKMSASGVNTDGWRLIKQDDDRFWFCFGGGTQNRCTPSDTAFAVYSTTHVVSGLWFHVAAVKSRAGFSVYVNGVREDSRSAVPHFVDSNTTDLLLGSYAGEGAIAKLDGLIDEVKVFNRALTDEEVRSAYSAASVGECR